MLEIGHKIRHLRDLKGFSQEALAKEADISTTFLGQIERGEVSPKFDKVEKLAEALGIDVLHLIGFDGQSFFVQNPSQSNVGINPSTNNYFGVADKERELYALTIATLRSELKAKDELIELLRKK